jgi:hypothetical protein
MYKIHHPNADIRGKYDICKKGGGGGIGLFQNEATYKAELSSTAEYVNTKHKEESL